MIAALASLAVSFALLTWLVQAGGPVVVLDGLIQAALMPLRLRPLLLAFRWLTQAGTGGTGAFVSLAASGLLWSGGRAGLVAPLWLAFLGSEATTWPLKFITARARPPFIEGLTAASPSYPSAHATVSVAVYGFLGLVITAGMPGRHWVLAASVALILLICFSRPLLSLHYASDVVGGMLVGAFWLVLAWGWARGGNT